MGPRGSGRRARRHGRRARHPGSLNRIRKAVVAEYQTGLVARETAERVIAAAKECEATLGEAEAVRDDVLAALDRQRASAVIYLQNSRMPTGGEDA